MELLTIDSTMQKDDSVFDLTAVEAVPSKGGALTSKASNAGRDSQSNGQEVHKGSPRPLHNQAAEKLSKVRACLCM